MKFFYKARGVISVFLIIIMLPLLTSAVLLVDGTRYQSAKTIVQEAGDLAAYSTIADYNMKLKDDYGLFAINSNDIESTFKSYLNDSLGYNASGNEDYSAKVQNIISNTVFGGGRYKNAKFYNMYNFKVDSATAKGLYPLSEPGVLQNQIVEYTKYRGVETIFERFEILDKFHQLSEEEESNSNKAAAIEDVSAVDSAYGNSVSQKLHDIAEMVAEYNNTLDELRETVNKYEEACAEEMAELAIKGDNISSKKQKRLDAAENVKTVENELGSMYSEIVAECDYCQYQAQTAKEKYEELKERYGNQSDIVGDINKEIEILNVVLSTSDKYRKYSVYCLKNSVTKPSDLSSSIESRINDWKINIESTYTNYNIEYNNLKEELSGDEMLFQSEINEQLETVRYHIYNKNREEWFYTADEEAVKNNYEGAYASAESFIMQYDALRYLDSHLNEFKMPAFENYYYVSAKSEDTSEIPDDAKDNDKYAKKTADSTNEQKNENKSSSEQKVKIEKSVFKSLPSQTKGTADNIEELEFDDINENNATDAIASANSASKKLLKILESGRNDILTYCYILDTFKTRLTAQGINSSDKPNGISDRNLVAWRYSNDKGELDLRNREKNSLTTYFSTNEVEYIFGGKASESTNSTIVYSWIYGTRLLNNIIAVYTNPAAKAECEMLAAASSAATLGAVPASVFKWLYIIAWAVGETCLEMNYLTVDGYKVPLIKDKNTLFIEHVWDAATAVANSDSLIREHRSSRNWADKINVSYEDYLIILLCFVNRETRLLRVADLIQLNMSKRYGAFKMASAYTYIKADTKVSFKYMFQPISQFKDSYNGTGLQLKNTIYQGY